MLMIRLFTGNMRPPIVEWYFPPLLYSTSCDITIGSMYPSISIGWRNKTLERGILFRIMLSLSGMRAYKGMFLLTKCNNV